MVNLFFLTELFQVGCFMTLLGLRFLIFLQNAAECTWRNALK